MATSQLENAWQINCWFSTLYLGATKYENMQVFCFLPILVFLPFLSTYSRYPTHCGRLLRLPVEMAKVDEHTLLSAGRSDSLPLSCRRWVSEYGGGGSWHRLCYMRKERKSRNVGYEEFIHLGFGGQVYLCDLPWWEPNARWFVKFLIEWVVIGKYFAMSVQRKQSFVSTKVGLVYKCAMSIPDGAK